MSDSFPFFSIAKKRNLAYGNLLALREIWVEKEGIDLEAEAAAVKLSCSRSIRAEIIIAETVERRRRVQVAQEMNPVKTEGLMAFEPWLRGIKPINRKTITD